MTYWQLRVSAHQRMAAAAFNYALLARDLYDAAIRPVAKSYHLRSWRKAMHLHYTYSRDARVLFQEWIGE